MKGSDEAIRVYTCDIIADYLDAEEQKPRMTLHEEKKHRVRQRLSRNKYKDQIFSGEI